MPNSFSHLILLLFFAANMTLASEQPLYTAEYEGRISGISVKLSSRLIKKSDNSYESKSRAYNFLGSIKELSRFHFEDNLIQVTFYEHRKKALGISRVEQTHFDWEKNIAKYTNREKPHKNTVHKLNPGILDPTIWQLQLQRDCINQVSDTKITFIKGDQIKERHFVMDKKEKFIFKDKTFEAVKYRRINYDDAKETYIWFIPKLDCQIGKILHVEENGDSSELLLVAYQSSSALIEEIDQSSNSR